MNILWGTNVELQEASLLMNEKPIPFGGLLVSTSTNLVNEDNIKLAMCFS